LTAPTATSTLSLHDALPIWKRQLPAQTPMLLPVGEIENRPQIMRNTLFLNRGDGCYAEIANFGGLEASEWSWQPLFIDVDLDGRSEEHTSELQSRFDLVCRL